MRAGEKKKKEGKEKESTKQPRRSVARSDDCSQQGQRAKDVVVGSGVF